MNDEDVRKIIDAADSYDEGREESALQMARDFYSRRMRALAIVVWVNALIGIAISIVAAVQFVRTDQVKQEIMYSAIFLVGAGWLGFAKIVAAVALVGNKTIREVKRLEIRLAEAMRQAGPDRPKP